MVIRSAILLTFGKIQNHLRFVWLVLMAELLQLRVKVELLLKLMIAILSMLEKVVNSLLKMVSMSATSL